MLAPSFFVPSVASSEQEESYAAMAALVQRPCLPVSERVYSIAFQHDGAEWEAVVGQSLRGRTVANPRSRSRRGMVERPVSDPAVVLAILPGAPYIVFTDGGRTAGERSRWENPFFAGSPLTVLRFR